MPELPPGMIKRGKYYWSTLRQGDIDARGRLSSDFKVAVVKLSKLRISLEEGTFRTAKNTEILFTEFSTEYERKYSRIHRVKSFLKTDAIYLPYFSEYFHEIRLRDIGREDVTEVQADLMSKSLKPPTVNKYLKTLNSMFNRAIEWRYIVENPMIKWKWLPEGKGRKRSLLQGEYPELMNHCDKKLKLIVEFAILTGFRFAEIQRIDRSTDLDRKNMLVYLGKTKNGDDIWHPINSRALEIIDTFKEDKPFDYRFTVGYRKAVKDAGLKNVDFHTLRHTYITWLLASGKHPQAVQQLARHSSIEQTMEYSHVMPSEVKQVGESMVTILSQLRA